MIIFAIILCLSIQSLAHTDSCFDICNYTPPEYRFHSLNLIPDFKLYGTFTQNDVDTVKKPLGELLNEPKGGISALYRYYSWKRGTEWNIRSTVSVSGTGFLEPETTDKETGYIFKENDSWYGYYDSEIEASFKHYFRWPFFIGAEIVPDIHYRKNNYISVSKRIEAGDISDQFPTNDYSVYRYQKSEIINSTLTADVSANIRLGIGRIEDVTFAVAALNMYDKIAEYDPSLKKCNANDIRKLAVLIEKTRRRRTFDSRIAFIENVGKVSDFFIQNRLSEKLSPREVLELADQWNYVFHQQRSKGYLFSVFPEIRYYHDGSGTRYNSRYCTSYLTEDLNVSKNDHVDVHTCELNTSYSWDGQENAELDYRLKMVAQYEQPLSRYLQLSIDAECIATLARQTRDTLNSLGYADPKFKAVHPLTEFSENVRVSWYPDTRTTLSIAQAATYYREFYYYYIWVVNANGKTASDRSAFDERKWDFSITGEADYYFSPRLFFKGSVGCGMSNMYINSEEIPIEIRDYQHHSTFKFNYSLSGNLTWKLF